MHNIYGIVKASFEGLGHYVLIRSVDFVMAIVVGFVFYNILLWYESSKAITITALYPEGEPTAVATHPLPKKAQGEKWAPEIGTEEEGETLTTGLDEENDIVSPTRDSLPTAEYPSPCPRTTLGDHVVNTSGDSPNKDETAINVQGLQKEKRRLQREIKSETQFYELKDRILSLVKDWRSHDDASMHPEKWFEKSKANIALLRNRLKEICGELSEA